MIRFIASIYVAFVTVVWPIASATVYNDAHTPSLLEFPSYDTSYDSDYADQTDCGEPPSIDGGLVEDGASYIGAQRTVTCRDANLGPFTISCTSNGKWTTPSGTCLPTCLNIERIKISNGFIESGPITVGSTRLVRCYDGYQMNGPAAIFCLTNGQWTQPGFCLRRGCGSPPTIKGGTVESGYSTVGAKRSIMCNDPSRGPFTITCQSDGEWSTPNGICAAVVIVVNAKPIVTTPLAFRSGEFETTTKMANLSAAQITGIVVGVILVVVVCVVVLLVLFTGTDLSTLCQIQSANSEPST